MKKILFLGDSITDAHRLWLPEFQGLGDGYVNCISDALKRDGIPVQVTNKGQDGFTLPALLRTLPDALSAASWDMITVLIGINDIAVSRTLKRSPSENEFSKHYERLLDVLRSQTSAALCCMGPFLFPHPQEFVLWMEDVRETEEIIASLAARYGLPFLPLHDFLNEAAQTHGYEKITLDGIHLTNYGHKLVAGQWLKTFRSLLFS